MSLKTKIVLSDKELALVQNGDWILTKHAIIQKVFALMNQSIPVIDQFISSPCKVIRDMQIQMPKIFKGENYLSLPYVTLDHPRFFKQQNILAVRTMFWWANFFSITFHVAGEYKEIFGQKIIANYHKIPSSVFFCIHEEQWHHHFAQDNYRPVKEFDANEMETLIKDKHFIKLALKFDLTSFDQMGELLTGGYKTIGEIIY